ncbi:DNA polymerase iota isoform X3 [Salvelinus namaycush]|uniref:DNA polymerase iota isoform X2 n=1 Tax=Salvelinus namaycush TaxID=8040 RepID=A0A8U1BYG5_SALNM|nr:DNA polymerase iota isoform X2 [Salvelinus namaycush]XP_038858398.1 DNA polymerase iota isoform X3 [Salvelinus namaycush]
MIHGGKYCSKVPVPPVQRVILHFDLDCFYAQVEMIRNPALRNVPLGIQQKYIIVTCNYVARDLGVTKLMLVTDAKEKCPQLVLVKGEDLTHYRETSYKVTELLMSFCPLVERLGFDENFMDITEMVERRIEQNPESAHYSYEGHVYNLDTSDAKVMVHPRLAVGSRIAAELRAEIHSKLGLTGCAGIATSKLLAKLVSGAFKPNQQTTLLPESVKDIMGSLNGLRKVPGVGHQTAKRLQALGLVSVQDLQLFPLADLVREFGVSTAQRLQNLALGIDDTPVTPTGAPQSLSDEDSFKKMSSTNEVWQKVKDLLSSILDRMHKDGRQPLTLRLTIRRYSATNKWFSRESRQCPIPNHIGQKITSGNCDALAQLVSMAMKLFHKMVDTNTAFHLTLLNVCFSNLQAKCAAVSKGSIASFFTHRSPEKTQASSRCQEDLSQSVLGNLRGQVGSDVEGKTEELTGQDASHWIPDIPSNLKIKPYTQSTMHNPEASQQRPMVGECCIGGTVDDKRTNSPGMTDVPLLPPNIDPEVFRLLPEDIQKELLSAAYPETAHGLHSHSTQSVRPTVSDPADRAHSSHHNHSEQPASLSQPAACKLNDSFHSTRIDLRETVKGFDRQPNAPTTNNQQEHTVSSLQYSLTDLLEEGNSSTGLVSQRQSADCGFPGNVDPKVFSELPPEVQRELLSEWRQQIPVLKISSSLKKQGKSPLAREKKAPAKSSQANDLLKYFKPSSG